MNTEKQDVYTRITNKIVADLEQGVRPWMKPWNASNTAGRVTRPLRHNGVKSNDNPSYHAQTHVDL